MTQLKTCKSCKEPKEYSKFSPCKSSSDGYRHKCRECTVKRYPADYVKMTWEEIARYKHLWYKGRAMKKVDSNRYRNLGVTPEEYAAKLESQGGVCAICGKTCNSGRRLSQDHCHATGKIRDLLCIKCNTALGGFNDDVDLLQKAIEYLKRHHG